MTLYSWISLGYSYSLCYDNKNIIFLWPAILPRLTEPRLYSDDMFSRRHLSFKINSHELSLKKENFIA